MGAAFLSLNRIQDLLDGPGALGAGDDGLALLWNNASGQFEPGAAGVSDHGAMSGLGDDDHTQYLLATGSRNTTGSHTYTAGANLTLAGGELSITEDVASNAPLTINLAAGQAAGALRILSSTGSFYGGFSEMGRVIAGAGSTASRSIQSYASSGAGIDLAIGTITMGLWNIDQLVIEAWKVRLMASQDLFLEGGLISVVENDAAAVPLTLKLAASHSADALQVQSAAAAVQLAVGPAGQIKTNQTAANTNTPGGATARQLALYDVGGTLLGYVPVYASAW